MRLLVVILCTLPVLANAAQLVAYDLTPQGVEPRVAQAASVAAVAELSRREGLSVVTQADVRALLQLESTRQLTGCDDEKCRVGVAQSLGAELLATGTVGRLGSEWQVALTLIDVTVGKPIRRSLGKSKGGEEVLGEAVFSAVQDLLRDGLPAEARGPVALTRRALKAAFFGYCEAAVDPAADPIASRRRVVMDLVNTELDYDAIPKIEMVQLELRRASGRFLERMLASRDAKERDRFIIALEHNQALYQDTDRVKEIRARARERGQVPTASALRFDQPEPGDRVDQAEADKLFRDLAAPRKVVESAMEAFQKRDRKTFVAAYREGYEGNANRAFDDDPTKDPRHPRWDVLPPFAWSPEIFEAARDLAKEKEGRAVIVLREWRDDKVTGTKKVYIDKDKSGAWRMSDW